MPTPTKQAPPPLQVDTARVVLVGIGLWTVALVGVLALGDRVDRMWTWTCLAAIGLAFLGLAIMRWQGAVTPASGGRRRQSHSRSKPPVS